MAAVELFIGDDYRQTVHLSIRSHKGHLVGVGKLELDGLKYGGFSYLEAPEDGDFEDLLLAVARAAAAVIEEKLDTVRALQAAAEFEASNAGRRAEAVARHEAESDMDEARIKKMVEQFLSWKLPANFTPDAGISFKPVVNEGTVHEHRFEPIGTNLFDATQAEAMVRHMLSDIREAAHQA